ncbi:MAG TPA: hypothetical protein VLI88_01375 [Patescibacteria group bacterium]|nr:hypothetical protein [Patescibacteria group bacterium]
MDGGNTLGESRTVLRISSIFAMFFLIMAVLAYGGAQANAAPLSAPINQCNNITASNVGGQGVSCTVTVVNFVTAGGSATGTPNTITVTTCSGAAGPIGAGAGTCATSTTTSATPVTQVTQCDGVANGGGGVLICSVTMTNNISGSATATPANIYQCIGSVITGPGAPGSCTPVNTPGITSVTAATVGQCNGSGNGGTSVGFTCSVGTGSTTSASLPVNVDQCNGSANGGGSLVRCTATVNNVILAATASPSPSATPTAAAATATPVPSAATATPARTATPVAGLPSTSTLDGPAPLMLGGVLLILTGALVVGSRRSIPTER